MVLTVPRQFHLDSKGRRTDASFLRDSQSKAHELGKTSLLYSDESVISEQTSPSLYKVQVNKTFAQYF